jgi:serine/threonine protein kinase
MEFVEGGNLRDFLTIRGKLSPLEATRCVLEIAQGLADALTRGLTHRDMKLTNVLMSARGVAKLVDFGLAGAEGSGPGGSARGESAQRAIEYATIEKGTGVQRDDPRSDLYFLGAIYFELLTGIPPFARTKDRVERAQFSRYAGVRPLSQVDASIPRSVTKVVERLMQINPNLRYQTPNEAIGDLRTVLHELMNGTAAPGDANNGKPAERTQPMVMCIENRPESQDVLRKYFSKHGYRPLILSDIERGLNRVRDNPPDCVVIMGEAVGEDAVRGYRKIPEIASENAPACVLVLSEKQKKLREDLTETGTMRIAQQPLSLRELHRLVHKALKRRGGPTILPHRKDDGKKKPDSSQEKP